MIIHSPIISGSLTFANGATFTLPSGGSYTGSFTGSFEGDGSNLSGVTSYTDSDTLIYINSLGVISGSSQITITESQISDLTHYTDSDVKTKLDLEGVISGSSQVSYGALIDIPIGIVSGSTQLIEILPAGTVSGSSQITNISNSQIDASAAIEYTKIDFNGSSITSGSLNFSISADTGSDNVQIGVDTLSIIGTANEIETTVTNNQVQIGIVENPTLSGNVIITGNLTVSGDTVQTNVSTMNVEDNIINLNYGGSQTTGGIYVTDATGDNTVSGSLIWDGSNGADYWVAGPSGSESKILLQNGDGVVSASAQITLTSTDNTGFDTSYVSENASYLYYTDDRVKNKLNDEGVISGSDQVIALPYFDNTFLKIDGDGVVSGSSQIQIDSVSGFTSFSESVDTRLVAAESANASGNDRLNSLESFSSSLDINFVSEVELGILSQSLDSRIDSLELNSQSLDTNYLRVNGDSVISSSAQVDLSYATGEVALGTHTVGSFVALIQTGSGGGIVTNGAPSGEGTNHTLSVDSTVLRTTGFGVISGSSQLTSELNNIYLSKNGDSVISSSTQLITEFDERYINVDSDGVVSGSSQIDGTSIQNNQITIAGTTLALGDSISFSTITAGTDVVSGSSQISYTGITDKPTLVSGSSQISYTGITDKPTLISGSSQVSFTDITNKPTLVSGSSQIDGTSIQNNQITIAGNSTSLGGSITYSTITNGTGTVSGSQQVSAFNTFLEINGDSVVSSSEQISNYNTFLEINGDDVVSGSSQINHDSTTGFVSNEHIDHSTVSITAGSGLTGGGTIASTRTLNVGQGDGISVSADSVSVDGTVLRTNDGVISGSSQVNHDSTTGFVANEHIDHSGVSITGIDGLSGGGNITTSRNISLDTTSVTFTSGVKTKLDVETVISGSSQVDHDQTTNFVSNEHINHSNVSITAGNGLTGGGDITSTRTLNIGQGDGISVSADSIAVDATVLRTNDGVISGSSQVDHDSTTNFVANEHINHANVSITAGNGLTGGGTIAATRTLNIGQGDGISVTADAIAVDNTVARTNSNNTFSGEQTFTDIVVNGTGSFAVLNSVSGEAKVIGDAFIILNADSPTSRYSGIKVYDSGSSDTGSLQYDSVNNHWFYESTTEGYASGLISGPRDTIGAITWPSNNKVVKGIGGNHIDDSNITDDGSTITLGSNSVVSGNLNVSGVINGVISGSSQVDHDSTTNFVANEHINHANVSITAGSGLTGGGTIAATRTLNVGGTANRISVSADAVDIASTYVGQTSITTLGTIGTGTWQGTAIADSYISSATAWNSKLDSAGTIANNDYAKYDANGDLTGRSYSEVKTDLSLNNVENTALSSWAGSSNITTLGTIGTGTWNGSVIASAYLDSDTAHLSGTQTFSGAKTFSAAVNITNSTASTSKTTGALKVTGGVGISGALNVGGDVVAYASSDRRLKDNIVNIENPIEKVQKLNGVTWDWNGNADELQQSLPNVGVIAQEVEEVFPQLVHDRENGYKGVDYAKLTGLLIEAIKEQQKQIDELKSKIV